MYGIVRVAIATTMIAAALPAMAKVTTVALGGVDYSTTPYTYDFGGGNTVTFSATGDFFNPAAVSTGGNTQIGSLGAPFYDPPQPTAYFFNRGGGFGPGREFPLFISYSAPATIAYSISESLIGLRFDVGAGYQYGYADIVGDTLKGIRFETTPGNSVAFGAVPEPSSWALMIVGFGLVAGSLRLTRRVRATA